MKMNWLLFIPLAACAMNAQASFNGQVILAEYLFPDASTVFPGEFTPAQATVGAGVEFSAAGIAVDFSSSNILWTNIDPTGSSVTFAPASFNGHRFTDLNGTIPEITGVTINAATTLAGFDASRVSFDANSIRVNFDSLEVLPEDIVSLDVTFAAAPPPAPQAVPTISALGLGLLGLLLGLIGIHAKRSRARS